MKSRITRIKDLQAHGFLPSGLVRDYEEIAQHYAIGISPHLAGLMAETSDNSAITAQYIPSLRELETSDSDMDDPIGDRAHSPVKGIVHRYPDRVLLKVSHLCAVYCRYCFRREMIGAKAGEDAMSNLDLDLALDYIRTNPDIWEVILTGGDPFILSPRRLQYIFEMLQAIDHIQIIRIHTRIPIADPQRVDQALLDVLKHVKKPLYIVLHVNHTQEINVDVETAISALRSTGAVLLSQSVLLKGVNDDAGILEILLRRLVTLRVKPYYLHHPDFAPGTSHFRLSLTEGQAIFKLLQGRLSGICMPVYVLDIPGGHGKIPVNHCYYTQMDGVRYVVEDYRGARHIYPPPYTGYKKP